MMQKHFLKKKCRKKKTYKNPHDLIRQEPRENPGSLMSVNKGVRGDGESGKIWEQTLQLALQSHVQTLLD